ncbi:MerR family transcriptional regulator [Massilia arenosa]|uniref:MerR family transcriptional regulator n=1 Tax=Zemynaea arenosa TaxID=2561931 RepID=A0A4Y9S6E6_9BURK|nr:MerR family transcriptional regulator [Massilia arenosa]TFW15611.1 MerR family transcriptional regulator [Massilia arenosa]
MSTYSIGQLARIAGVSRTTLLYYEQAGLLVPRARSAAGYRHYDEAAAERARRIAAYRATGMPLASIAALLDGQAASAIEQRLGEIAREMALLREQQAVLLRLLGKTDGGQMDKDRWTALLREAGMDDAAMARWHALFERQSPDAHASFLRSLGLDDDEVSRIRSWAAGTGQNGV